MIKFVLMLVLMLTFVAPAFAEDDLISPRPYCGTIKNTTDFIVTGSIRTAYGTQPETGEKLRHDSNFRLKPDGEREVCATGPFYPGYKVEFILKTLIPVFVCKTKLKGTIEIKAEKLKDGGNRLYAICVE